MIDKKVGDKITVCYDARPLYPYTEYEGEVVKITTSGFLKVKEESGRAELYDPCTGVARGWRTLWLKRE